MPRATDTRGRIVPEDRLTHIERINDWAGSMPAPRAGRHPPTYDPRTPLLPYMLRAKATDRQGLLRRAGEVVELHASEVAAHHAQLPNVDYTPHRPTARAEALVGEVRADYPDEFRAAAKDSRRKKEADD